MLHHPSLRSLRIHVARRSNVFAVLIVFLIVPLLAQTPPVAPLPPITAIIERLPTTSGTQAHGTLANNSAAPTASSSAANLLRLHTTTVPKPGRTRYVSFYSAALDRMMKYWIYLPPTYNTSQDRFAVLYMLHGLGGSEFQWKSLGLFNKADALIRAQQIAPLIIVTPQGDNGYWMNQANDGPRYANYVIKDLIPEIDATYRTMADARHRAIGGLSMGGHGAIQLALNHPGMFSVVGGHSPVFRDQEQAFTFFGTGAEYQRRDPVSIVNDLHVSVPFKLWLDMGRADEWLARTELFAQILKDRGIAHEWHLNPGEHQMTYWAQQVPTYLKWYDQALRTGITPSQPTRQAPTP